MLPSEFPLRIHANNPSSGIHLTIFAIISLDIAAGIFAGGFFFFRKNSFLQEFIRYSFRNTPSEIDSGSSNGSFRS